MTDADAIEEAERLLKEADRANGYAIISETPRLLRVLLQRVREDRREEDTRVDGQPDVALPHRRTR